MKWKLLNFFEKVMSARPEKTKNKKTKESLRCKQKATQRETTFSSMKCEFTILLYLFSVFVFDIWFHLTSADFGGLKLSFS